VYAYSSPSYWIDIGTPEKYFQLHRDLLNGKSHSFDLSRREKIQTGKGCRIDSTCQIQGTVLIGDNCSLDRGVKLIGPVILGPGCAVQEDTLIQESIAWKKVTFGPKTTIKGSLIANDCFFEADCSVEKTVIGDHIIVSRKTKLGTGSRIWPPAE